VTPEPGELWRDFAARALSQWAAQRGAARSDLARVWTAIHAGGRVARAAEGTEYGPELLVPGLGRRRWYTPELLAIPPAALELVPRVLAELTRAVVDETLEDHPESGKLVTSGSWRRLPIYMWGEPVDDVAERYPTLAQFVATIPGGRSAGSVLLAALTPDSSMRPHYGPTNARIQCHLALTVPSDCGLEVGGETGAWEPGALTLFDDAYTHRVWNHGPGPRIVLIFPAWHPELSTLERDALDFLFRGLPRHDRFFHALPGQPSFLGGPGLL
jgi:hypothetical protein